MQALVVRSGMVLRVVPPGGADLIVQSLGAGWYMPLSAIGACVGHELPIEPHLLALLAGDYPEVSCLISISHSGPGRLPR
jgi:hypothetical protein